MLISRVIRKIACSTRLPMYGVLPTSGKDQGYILTFDDGPDPVVTPLLLDLLQEFKISAVFFILGINIPGNEDIIKRIVDEGHLLGNHSYRHQCLTDMERDEFTQDVINFQNRIDGFIPASYRIFRPPQGLITLPQLFYLKNKKIDLMLWSFDSRDSWLQTPEEIALYVEKNVGTRNHVILFHDDNIKVVNALKILFTSQSGFLDKILPPSRLLNEKSEV